jgi:hypothetical protein
MGDGSRPGRLWPQFSERRIIMIRTIKSLRLWMITLSCATVLLPACIPAAAGRAQRKDRTTPAHLDWATKMVAGLKIENTSYRHKDLIVQWQGVDDAKEFVSHADCSGFLNELIKRAYGLTDDTFKDWWNTKRPLAKTYHYAIVEGKHFKRIEKIQDVAPGDIIAIKYSADDPENEGNNTGHTLLVAAKPQPRQATPKIVDGTEQWEVAVIDQSCSGHGDTDTRYHKADKQTTPSKCTEGKDAHGLGQGIFRIYATKEGCVAGYTWSTWKGSSFHPQDADDGRHLVFGRLCRGIEALMGMDDGDGAVMDRPLRGLVRR